MIIEIHKPELERLIRERMERGGVDDVEEVLIEALRSTLREKSTDARKPKQTLGQFLLESPLRDSGLKLERQRDYPRPIEL